MAACEKISYKKRQVCVGALNRRITLQTRELKTISISNVDIEEVFTDIKTVWANVKTSTGFKSFNNVGTSPNDKPFAQTTKMYIRYSSSLELTSENWVLFNDERYIIQSIENLDEQDQFLVLHCVKKGDDTKKANDA